MNGPYPWLLMPITLSQNKSVPLPYIKGGFQLQFLHYPADAVRQAIAYQHMNMVFVCLHGIYISVVKDSSESKDLLTVIYHPSSQNLPS